MTTSNSSISYYGIRHHGPGCASSLKEALHTLQPDCIVIEGPTGAEDLLKFIQSADMVPPVAMLTYSKEDPRLSTFHPFAVFSPEWQAILYAQQAQIPVRFMDLPPAHTLAIQQEVLQKQAKEQKEAISADADADAEQADINTPQENQHSEEAIDVTNACTMSKDPLDWLAQAAGYTDGESWWNHMIEERTQASDLFEAIAHAMTELRKNAPQRSEAYETQEARREAYMRLEIKKAQKAKYQRIAVVCGAWHVPALQQDVTTKADQEILKGLPKIKTETTWVPWTYQHLSATSGYGAGVTAPGWYEYLWHISQNQAQRSIGWFVRIAQLLRQHDLDCSSAHLIEASRLADALAAMRNRPAPSLTELNEAALSVICNVNDAPMRLIERELMIGNTLGTIPLDVPTVPLQQDLHSQQKSLRLKPEALSKSLDLDLRKETDLARSHLLHRLNLLDINWGHITNVGQSAKGTFHEYWQLAWQPSFEVEIIIASRYGYSIASAATSFCIERAQKTSQLAELTKLMDKVLLADLPQAVQAITKELEERSVGSADPIDLLNALPALANIYRYGNVRQTDVTQVAHLFDSMLQRAVIALPLAVSNINAEAAEEIRATLLAAERAVNLRSDETQTKAWQQALHIIANNLTTAPLLRGMSCRLLFDANIVTHEQVAQELSLNLSVGIDPEQAAHWLDGFLNRNATILLHNDSLWVLIDQWLSALSDEHFITILPLVRRTFSQFEAADRRDLSTKTKQDLQTSVPSQHAQKQAQNNQTNWHDERVQNVLHNVSNLLGIPL